MHVHKFNKIQKLQECKQQRSVSCWRSCWWIILLLRCRNAHKHKYKYKKLTNQQSIKHRNINRYSQLGAVKAADVKWSHYHSVRYSRGSFSSDNLHSALFSSGNMTPFFMDFIWLAFLSLATLYDNLQDFEKSSLCRSLAGWLLKFVETNTFTY